MEAKTRKLLDTRGLEQEYGIPAGYWNKRRVAGDGPPFLAVGRRRYYDPRVVDAWLASKRRTSTSDDGADALPPEPRPAPPSGGKPAPPRRRDRPAALQPPPA